MSSSVLHRKNPMHKLLDAVFQFTLNIVQQLRTQMAFPMMMIMNISVIYFLAINGYMYGYLPNLTMCAGDKVKWYLFSLGNEADIHSAYFHGQLLVERKQRVDTIQLFPATFVDAVMVPKDDGEWLLSCQVNDHIEGIK